MWEVHNMKNLRLDRPLAFIDVETTGLSPYSDRIVERCKFNEQFWCKTSNTSGQL